MKSMLVMNGEEIYKEGSGNVEKVCLGGILIDSEVWLEG